MPSIIQIVTILIATMSLLMAYLGFRDKKSDKTDRDLADRIKATVLSDAVTVKAEALSVTVNAKAAILSDAVNARGVEIKELQKQVNDIENRLIVTDERVSVLTKQLEKLSNKLDHIVDI